MVCVDQTPLWLARSDCAANTVSDALGSSTLTGPLSSAPAGGGGWDTWHGRERAVHSLDGRPGPGEPRLVTVGLRLV